MLSNGRTTGTDRGAGEVLLTSWDRDGTRAGYDLALTRAVAAAVRVPVIASGGAATPAASEGGVRCRRRRGARRLDLPRRRHDGRRRQARARGARRARAAMICRDRPPPLASSAFVRRLLGLDWLDPSTPARPEHPGKLDRRIEASAVRFNSLFTSGGLRCPVCRWSMRSWESVRPRRNRRQRIPRSHGPAKESVKRPGVNCRLILRLTSQAPHSLTRKARIASDRQN